MIRLADDENAIDEADAIARKAVEASAIIARAAQAELIEAILRSEGSLSDAVFEAVFGASEQIGEALFDSQIAAFLESGAEAAKPVIASLTSIPERIGIGPPAKPPTTAELIYRGDAAPRIRFPIIERAGKLLSEAKILEPADYYALSAEAKSQAFTVSGGLAEATIEKVAKILDETFATTSSRTEFMKAIEDRIPTLPIGEAHLEQVFRNNVNGAYSDGGEAILASPMVEDAFPFRAYYAIRDERVREDHLALETSGLSGTNIFYHRDPVWKTFRPPWDWNAVLPGTRVEGRVLFALKTRYAGQVFEVATKRGRRFAVTANHPVLTRRGFVAAKALCEGDELIGDRRPGESAIPGDNVNDGPSRIDQVFDSLRRLSGAVSREVADLDFHGDARFGNGKVEVVGADRELLDRLDSGLRKRSLGGDFSLPDLQAEFLALKGRSVQFSRGSLRAADGSVRGGSIGGAVAVDAVPRCIGAGSRLDFSRYQNLPGGVATDSVLFGELEFRFPSNVAADEVSSIAIRHYDGPVYDLQTDVGYFLANGIVVSNCRCGWAPMTIRQAARLGVAEAVAWLETGVMPSSLFVPPPPFLPSSSWLRVGA